MSSQQHQRELSKLQAEEGRLRTQMAKHEKARTTAEMNAASKAKSLNNAKSASSIQSIMRAIDSERRKAAEEAKKAQSIASKIETNLKRQQDRRRWLDQDLKKERVADARDNSRSTQRTVMERFVSRRISAPLTLEEPEPEKMRVLYMTASPIGEGIGHLRVDGEVSSVLKAVRGSKYRDLIDIHQRPAASSSDLLDGINDIHPHVIHFSGHAGEDGLLLDNGSLTSPGEVCLSYEQLARALRATATLARLVVLNACDTAEGADRILASVPVVVAMNAPVNDIAAAIFATQFYAAIGGGQSVGHAVEQGIVQASLMNDEIEDAVQVFKREEVDIDGLVMIRT